MRFPFSLWMTEQATPVPDDYLAANPDLSGATPMQVYDACVEALTGAGLVVIPNCHTLDAGWCRAEVLASGKDGDQTLGGLATANCSGHRSFE